MWPTLSKPWENLARLAGPPTDLNFVRGSGREGGMWQPSAWSRPVDPSKLVNRHPADYWLRALLHQVNAVISV